MSVTLTEKDKTELIFLEQRIDQLSSSPHKIREQKRFFEAVKNGNIERAGVDAGKKYIEGTLGFLEREQGKRGERIFHFQRAYRINNAPVYLDSLLELEPATASYAHLEEKQLKDRLGTRNNEKNQLRKTEEYPPDRAFWPNQNETF